MRIQINLLFTLLSVFSLLNCSENSTGPKTSEPFVDPTPRVIDTLDILFIGNSLTGWNDMTFIFQAFADSTKKNINIGEAIAFGSSLADHLGFDRTINKINERNWDHAIIQGSNYGIAFEEHRVQAFDEIRGIYNLVKNNCRSTNIILFLDYALEQDISFDGTTYYRHEEFENMIYTGTKIISDSLGIQIAPVGWVWKQVFRERQDIDLYVADKTHPSIYGSYIMACVYYSTIFKEVTSGIKHLAGLSDEEALFIQRLSSAVVLDNQEMWNLR